MRKTSSLFVSRPPPGAVEPVSVSAVRGWKRVSSRAEKAELLLLHLNAEPLGLPCTYYYFVTTSKADFDYDKTCSMARLKGGGMGLLGRQEEFIGVTVTTSKIRMLSTNQIT